MSKNQFYWAFGVPITLSVLLLPIAAACDSSGSGPGKAEHKPIETLKEKVEDKATDAIHGLACKQLHRLIPGGTGYGVPGYGDAPRWGMPEGKAGTVRVRRSFGSLSEAEKQKVIDAFIKLKQVTVDSQEPGAARARYTSFCQGDKAYATNLYDYYVEAHVSAFVSMHTDEMSVTQMAHMGPQFLPWHRYLLLRIEADMREAIGDPEFTLPYWDWQDCNKGGGDKLCSAIFDSKHMGSAGSCEQRNEVSGYLTDRGFVAHIYTHADARNIFKTASVECGPKLLEREVGCGVEHPPTSEDERAMYTRTVYDSAPYDSCGSDEAISFRQYLEGYTKTDINPVCVIGGCQMHGQGHLYIGGDMANGGAAPNEPMFFLHHANVDRMWALWQDANMTSGDKARAVDSGNPGYPADYRGPLFIWNGVRAEETFDHRALGYRYDDQKDTP